MRGQREARPALRWRQAVLGLGTFAMMSGPAMAGTVGTPLVGASGAATAPGSSSEGPSPGTGSQQGEGTTTPDTAAHPPARVTETPRALDASTLPEDRVKELEKARVRLVDAIDRGVGERTPKAASRARDKFDCWVAGFQRAGTEEEALACRREFYVAVYLTENGILPTEEEDQGAMPAVHRGDGIFEVYFEANSWALSRGAGRAIRTAAAYAGEKNRSTVLVSGYSDSFGDDRYNLLLSDRRAQAVRDALLANGVAEERIIRSAFGETAPMVPTGDGVREPYNRRVEIDLR